MQWSEFSGQNSVTDNWWPMTDSWFVFPWIQPGVVDGCLVSIFAPTTYNLQLITVPTIRRNKHLNKLEAEASF